MGFCSRRRRKRKKDDGMKGGLDVKVALLDLASYIAT